MANLKIQSVLAQMQKNLECSICLEMMQNPVSTSCGHQFCRFCIMECLERKKQVPCPLCKKTVTKRGLTERKQLGDMVSSVHKLIEAYQADTGSLFSPPRGNPSSDLLPCTPESIKPSKTGNKRSNVRRSGRPEPNQKSLCLGESMDNIDLKTELDTEDKSAAVGRRRKRKGKDVQELLNIIETGLHGACNDPPDNKSELCKDDSKNKKGNANKTVLSEHFDASDAKEKSQNINDECFKTSKPDKNSVRNSVVNRESTEKNNEKHEYEPNDPLVADIGQINKPEDLTQSDVPANSQASSDDIVSLFRTPIDVKEVTQKKSSENKKPELSFRSLRSKKNVSNENEEDDSEPCVFTQDDKDVADVFKPKPEKIKTYSKKNTAAKDVKNRKKVSEWLKQLPNESDGKVDSSKKGENSSTKTDENSSTKTDENSSTKTDINSFTKTDVNSRKKTNKKATAIQQKSDIMGQRMKTFADKVNKDDDALLFGFEGLDETCAIKPCGNDDSVKTLTDIQTDKVVKNRDGEIVVQHEGISQTENSSVENEAVNSKEIGKEVKLTEDENKESPEKVESGVAAGNDIDEPKPRPVQKKRIFKSKQKVSNCNERKEANGSLDVSSKSDLKATNEMENSNLHQSIEIVRENDKVQENLKEISEASERLLKFSNSPVASSQEKLDPFEFKSSQKTPQKPKAKKARKKKANSKNAVNRKPEGINEDHQREGDSPLKSKSKSKRNKSDVVQSNKGINNPELKKLAANLDQAEEYDLLTSTQEALQKMPDINTDSEIQKNQSSDGQVKKRVRFREPPLADFLSPGRMFIKSKRYATDEGVHGPGTVTKVKPLIGIQKCSSVKESVGHTSRHATAKKKHISGQENKDERKEKPSNDSDSDDLSEDYRFHDDSSGTDDLEINPDLDEFENPDFEKQPAEVKVQLGTNEADTATKSHSDNSSPNITSVTDTPQVFVGPRFKTSLLKPPESGKKVVKSSESGKKVVKSSESGKKGVKSSNSRKKSPKVVDIIAETPLLVGHITTVAETPMLDLPEERNGKGENSIEDLSENPVLGTINDKTEDTEAENDRNATDGIKSNSSKQNSTEIPQGMICKDNEGEAVIKDIEVVGKSETMSRESKPDKTKPEDGDDVHTEIQETDTVNDNPINFDIGTLEEGEQIIADSVDDDDEAESVDSNLYIATKASDHAELLPVVDNDETQTPPDVIELVENNNEIYDHQETDHEVCYNIDDSKDNNTGSLISSQASISVLVCENQITGETVFNAREEIAKTGSESQSVKPVVETKKSRKKKKKRKCFMLEDTQEQESVDASTSESAPYENTPKRQRTQESGGEITPVNVIQETELACESAPYENTPKWQRTQGSGGDITPVNVIQETELANSEVVIMSSGIQLEKEKHIVESDKNKTEQNVDSGNGSQDDLVLISQSPEGGSPPSDTKERHLSGMLISPNDNGSYQSPENIFCIDSEMPLVDLSPEEETQATDDNEIPDTYTRGDTKKVDKGVPKTETQADTKKVDNEVPNSETQGGTETVDNEVQNTETQGGTETVDNEVPNIETQGGTETVNPSAMLGESFTQRTHVSDTQKSMSQKSISQENVSVSDSGKRKGGVRAARGFSKRARHSDESNESLIGTPNTPKTSSNFSKRAKHSDESNESLIGTPNTPKTASNFSKRAKHSDESNESLIGTPNTPKTSSNFSNETQTPKSQRLLSDNIGEWSNAVSPSVSRHSNTPKSINIMKYKSPIAGIKPLLNHKAVSVNSSSPALLASPELNKISKYSPGVQRITPLRGMVGGSPHGKGSPKSVSRRSPKGRESPVPTDVEVVEIEIQRPSAEVEEDDALTESDDVSPYSGRKRKSPKIRLQLGSQERSKMLEEVIPLPKLEHVNETDDGPLIQSEYQDVSIVQESGDVDLDNRYLVVGSSVGVSQNSEQTELKRKYKKDRFEISQSNGSKGRKKNVKSDCNQSEMLQPGANKESYSKTVFKNRSKSDATLQFSDNELNHSKTKVKASFVTEDDDDSSSSDLCFDETDDESDKSENENELPEFDLQSKSNKKNKIGNDNSSIDVAIEEGNDNVNSEKFDLSPSLCLESLDKDADTDDSEAEVIEESDLEEESDCEITTDVQSHTQRRWGKHADRSKQKKSEQDAFQVEEKKSKKGVYQSVQKNSEASGESERQLDGDEDEIRKVKRIRPKRAVLSDSESDSGDESFRLDCTSSSAFSSQSENLTTQERKSLEKDLEKMAAEMAQLKNQLKKDKRGSREHEDNVLVLGDEDEERIETDDSEVEIEHELYLSPPPFFPVTMSQEKSLEEEVSQRTADGMTEDQEQNVVTTADKMEVEIDKRNPQLRRPLKDIDVNVVRGTFDAELTVKEEPITDKKILGLVATGLSSLQVMEIKKLAAVSDAKFFSKMNPAVSHVIVRPDDEDKQMCDRTLKFFQGIAHNCWIVTYRWIIDSKSAGHLLPEDPYEIQGDTTMACLHLGPKTSRLSQEPLFRDLHFALFGENKYLNKESLSELIQTVGGSVVDMLQLKQYGKSSVVICCTDLEEEGSQQEREVTAKSKEFMKRYGVKTLKRDWVMDSLTTYKLQPVKPYIISDVN